MERMIEAFLHVVSCLALSVWFAVQHKTICRKSVVHLHGIAISLQYVTNDRPSYAILTSSGWNYHERGSAVSISAAAA